ncbi:MAG: hypothetical protein HKN14_00610 [Marinicaulis sp.]|nr:hypothetical protein [Marinicaulis sp.]
MDGANPILIGVTVLLAAASIGAIMALPPRARPALVFAQLVLMTGIYIGFAVIGLEPINTATRPEWSAVLIESLIAIAFIGAGLNFLHGERAWVLGALILGHGGADLMHLLMDVAHSPDWYEFLCTLFDAIVGFAAIWLLSQKSSEIQSP